MQLCGVVPDLSGSTGADLMRNMTQQTVQAWNEHFRIGQAVRVYLTYGDESTAFDTVTTSTAEVMADISAAVQVAGKADRVCLTHVKPLVGRATCSLEALLHPPQGLITLREAVAILTRKEQGL